MRALLLLVSIGAFLGANLRADAPDQAQADSLFQQLVTAVTNDDYDSFVANGTTQLKAALTKIQIEALSNLMGAHLKGGFDSDQLGELNKKGFQVFIYRLRFKDSSDDILGVMSLKDGQVAGIYFK